MKSKKKLKKIGKVVKLLFEEMGLKIKYFNVNQKEKFVACFSKILDIQIYLERGEIVPTIYCMAKCSEDDSYFWEKEFFDFEELGNTLMDALSDRQEVINRYNSGERPPRMLVQGVTWVDYNKLKAINESESP